MPKNTPRRIAFVLDTKAGQQALICYVLTNVESRHDHWKVWRPQYEGHKAKDRSARRYAQALFVVLARAAAEASTSPPRGRRPHESERQPIRFTVSRNDKHLGYWTKLLYDRIQAAHGKYEEIPAAVRKGISSLIRARGKRGRNGHARIEVAENHTDSVLFWNAASEVLASKDLDRHAEEGTPVFIRSSAPTRLGIPLVCAESKLIPRPGQSETWQDLYCRFAVERKYLSSGQWMGLTCRRVRTASPQQHGFDQIDASQTTFHSAGTTGPPLTLREVVATNSYVLLTGAAGTGKTTAMRMLANDFLLEDPGLFPRLLPFYLPLKKFEPYIISSFHKYGEVNVGRLVGRVASLILLKGSAQLSSSPGIRRLITKWRPHAPANSISDDDLLACVTEEISTWFQDSKYEGELILLLCDGINELRPWTRDALAAALQTLRADNMRVLISSRQNITESLHRPTVQRLAIYELQELSEHDIRTYVDRLLPKQGRRFFQNQIRRDPKVFSMAKNPFWLSLIGTHAQSKHPPTIPSSRAGLLAGLVSRTIRRKWEDCVHPENQVQHDTMWAVLPAIAKWAMDCLTIHQTNAFTSFTASPLYKQLACPLHDLVEVIQEAEAYGLLAAPADSDEVQNRLKYPRFSHDNIRDFFAAQYLLEYRTLKDVPDLENILEYSEWDTALEMYFGLINDEQELSNALGAIVKFDPLLASRCLVWAKCSTQQHAQSLLCLFPLDRLGKIVLSPGNHTHYGIGRALSNILSVMNPDFLESLFYESETNAFPPSVIAYAFVRSLGAEAFPYLRKFADSGGGGNVTDILGPIRNLGTEDSWKYLCKRYVADVKKRQARGESHPDAGHFVPILSISAVSPPPDVVATCFQYVKTALNISERFELIYWSMEALVSPIAEAGKEYREELLTLCNSSSKIIACAATRALRNQRDPSIVASYVRQFQEDRLSFLLGFDTGERLKVLTELADADIDNQLWTMFLDQTVNNESYPVIAWQLAPRADDARIAQVLSTLLSLDAKTTVDTIRALVTHRPAATLEYLKNEMREEDKHTRLWCRLTAARGLCDDISVKADLLDILSRIEHIGWVAKTRTVSSGPYVWERQNTPLLVYEFQQLVFSAVKRLKLSDAKPILKTLIADTRDDQIRSMAQDCWIYLTDIQIQDHDDALIFARVAAKTYTDIFHYQIGCLNFQDFLREWPEETLELVLTAMRDVIEDCIEGRLDIDPVYVYGLLSHVRMEKGRRYLGIFAGWPCSPPKSVQPERSSKKKRRTSSRRSTKHKKS